MVKQAGVIAWLGGIAALIGLVTWSGLGAVGQAVSSVGWGILLVVLARAVALVVAGVGWWLLFPSKMRPQLRTCVLLRFVREATNVLLPLAQVGGDLIGAGLLTLYAVPGALGIAVAALMLAGFYLAQRRGGQRILRAIVSRLAGDREWRVLGTIDAVYQNLGMIYAARSNVIASGVVHLAGWAIGVAEVAIVFAFMGHPVGIGEALVIESL